MKSPILMIRALQDTFSDSTRVTVTEKELLILCSKLAEKIKGKYKPELIVSIATGGTLPGKLLSTQFDILVENILIRRNISIGRMYNTDPFLLRWIMSLYHHYLFQTTIPTIVQETELDVKNKRILIVDDAYHTGSTMGIARNYLTQKGAKEIKTATLSYVSKGKPDFYVLKKGNYSYPWSKDFVGTL